MRLFAWLQKHDVRLDVVIRANFDPVYPEPRWRCEISGFVDPDWPRRRPAVFLTNVRSADAYIVGFGDNPNEAFARAVNLLRGKRVRAVLRERNEFLTIPHDLTV